MFLFCLESAIQLIDELDLFGRQLYCLPGLVVIYQMREISDSDLAPTPNRSRYTG